MTAQAATGLYAMQNVADAGQKIWSKIGALNKVKVFGPQVLIATYTRSDEEKTAGGIIIPGAVAAEDEYQGKVGMVVKLGPCAFEENEKVKFNGVTAAIGDWVVYSCHDGLSLKIRGIHCRIIDDIHVRLGVPSPDMLM